MKKRLLAYVPVEVLIALVSAVALPAIGALMLQGSVALAPYPALHYTVGLTIAISGVSTLLLALAVHVGLVLLVIAAPGLALTNRFRSTPASTIS